MPDSRSEASSAAARPDQFTLPDSLIAYLAGERSPPLALMQLLLHCGSVTACEQLLEAAGAHGSSVQVVQRQGLEELRHLLASRREQCLSLEPLLQAELPGDDGGQDSVSAWAQFFDAAVAQAAPASVALYSLGDPELLDAATGEVLDYFTEQGLLGPRRRILQIGCGIGRFEAVLAPLVAEAHGIDISPGMINAARQRCAGLANVHLACCSGRDLAPFADFSLDMVYAVDSFPYLHESGGALLETHFAESARVLTRGGDLLILNFSYRNDPEQDSREINRLATRHGFKVLVDGVQPFRLWDGRVWHLRLA
ncbi:class I SAM-dependent methyltransferase [Thermithiobacillus plumbiphilus]|uniref:Class I SAM-dependent methyltransferase n=1 Tax=Thermithiobacillus plumbiphilus TaxID=1729899 RepID=A0ABU9DB54_9PROT